MLVVRARVECPPAAVECALPLYLRRIVQAQPTSPVGAQPLVGVYIPAGSVDRLLVRPQRSARKGAHAPESGRDGDGVGGGGGGDASVEADSDTGASAFSSDTSDDDEKASGGTGASHGRKRRVATALADAREDVVMSEHLQMLEEWKVRQVVVSTTLKPPSARRQPPRTANPTRARTTGLHKHTHKHTTLLCHSVPSCSVALPILLSG